MTKEYVKSGKVKVLAVASEKRLTDSDSKMYQLLKSKAWMLYLTVGLASEHPKGLPAAEKNKLADGIEAIVHDPEFQKNIQSLGLTVGYLGSQAFGEKWIAEHKRFAKVMKESGIAEQITAQKMSLKVV